MKLASYLLGEVPSFGIVRDDEILDVGDVTRARFGSLRNALGALDEIQNAAQTEGSIGRVSDVHMLPPIPDAGRVICIGRNYRADTIKAGLPVPDYPILFLRYPDTLVGHQQPIIRPCVSDQFDWEGELAFVIGKAGRHIARETASEHVVGYCCFNDGSVRDYQRHTTQDAPGKNFWRSGSFGPFLVTSDELPDVSTLSVTSTLNGEQMQYGQVADFIFSIPDLIAYLSSIFPLQPGDVVATGTPLGCGVSRDPKIWLKPGDVVEVSIEGVGTLRNHVEDEPRNALP
jgi:2-keto-4-pentenoate hydratase/2-oxohepta-3-ene-1,7-dioic acid hydratase in catechol pathway